ncbi:M23 family metallopeptidase [Oscillatoria amoena NRMC-F 0135]|uniref:M23 family metallopeptidase n=1 Tax=Geitlerinema calcuttense NRMC-F 0142 TaxID=2922238 RepID=A0ABT7LWR0_9CYAN|nr:M23 family metallopeptidase [Geitlerinema calcuttense]MCD8485253.1 M23 family metallopeptidase [Desertifilum sp.]MDI9638757.1 M23 family metallopeptidase [Geitlerinema splendidum]MDL5045593.1 M23 family metallopeptidase [Oscillatoria amoena NRMC-F 0135]MDL5056455.1 M23 family metallopeptidase [Geitlerinema calcuttense NRMC-F 0142]
MLVTIKIHWLMGAIALLGSLVPSLSAIAQPSENATCPQQPALSRLTRHRVAAGETIESIAEKYNLMPATLMGMNPVLQGGTAPVGTELEIPPYNGIRVQVPAGQTLPEIAEAYNVRPDVLFEVNGCQTNLRVAFVPGVNWSPGRPAPQVLTQLSGYPLPQVVEVARGYGWQVNPLNSQVSFNSGVALQAATGTPVLAVGEGTVAFAGDRGAYGNLVVINHAGGRQSRYAHLATLSVAAGQQVQQGDRLGTVGTTGTRALSEPHLHFEVRYNSPLGWVAEDPGLYIQAIQNAQKY